LLPINHPGIKQFLAINLIPASITQLYDGRKIYPATLIRSEKSKNIQLKFSFHFNRST
jgi:hypothetical protein